RWGVYPWREYGKLSGCGRGAESKPITHTIPHQMDARPLGGVASRRASVDLPAPGGPERITARPASQGLPASQVALIMQGSRLPVGSRFLPVGAADDKGAPQCQAIRPDGTIAATCASLSGLRTM